VNPNPRIAIILSNAALLEQARAVAAGLGDGIAVAEGSLGAGVEAARRAVAAGAEVIVSRGGTALAIRRELDVPVVEIKVSPFDVLRGLRELGPGDGPVGIVGFENIVRDCEDFGNLLGLPLRLILVRSDEDAREKIEAASRQGVRTFVGDALSTRQAVSLGLKVSFISSGEEAIARAVEEARAVAGAQLRERERAELLRVIVDSSRDGIVAIDQNDRIFLFNRAAEAVFSIPAAQAIGENAAAILPNTELPRIVREEVTETGALQRVGARILVTHRRPVTVNGRTVAAVGQFQDVTELQRLEQIVRQKLHARRLVAKATLDGIVGASEPLRTLKERAARFAQVDASVLVYGATGTGKELFAQAIHNASRRASGPFVVINCAALPEALLESELFGYEEGAFTGARKGGKPGLFEVAHGGTLFLDEIGEMAPQVQTRLLRVLQEHEVLRLGGARIIPVDVRVIAATNRHLPTLVREHRFREDLFYRLAVLQLTVPPLRDRPGDVPPLVELFAAKHRRSNARVRRIDDDAVEVLARYAWPGNVRELEHVVQRLIILSDEEVVGRDAAEAMLRELEAELASCDGTGESPAQALRELEDHAIARALAESGNNVTRAAKRLGIDRSTLRRKLGKARPH
jgi:PAS domain S-box-containing protein